MIILLLIEYIHVYTASKGLQMLGKSAFRQITIATLLGAIPCCVGGFAAVSLFTHGTIGFGALLAALIASMGDEALVMFSLFPKQALLLQGILIVLAWLVGFAANKWGKRVPTPFLQCHLQLHHHEQHQHHSHHLLKDIHSQCLQNLKNITFERALLLAGLLIFAFAIAGGLLQHTHHQASPSPALSLPHWIADEQWLNVLFLLLSVLLIIIVLRASDHFLEEHLWGHIIKKHFLRIFVWALCALAVIAVLEHYIEAQTWVSSNPLLMLLAALLIGLIPASGPHLLFALLFVSGNIPFYVLLANTLVQDGHAALPLLAESPKGFLYSKAIKVAMAAVVGGLCFFWN
ncbi:hypothetical protein FACS1894156_6810 [Bacteroidia bacterium]|nr:hypothetical protein FACS1894156_6810 [Bacteroidia bacterium]